MCICEPTAISEFRPDNCNWLAEDMITIHFPCFCFPAFLLLLGLNSHCIISLCTSATDEDHSTVIETSGSVFLLVFG